MQVWGGGYRWSCWDVGGGERLRPLWSSYTRATDGLVFVVDSASPTDVMEEARVELARVLKVIICVSLTVCMYVCMFVCLFVYLYVCVCVCVIVVYVFVWFSLCCYL